jgi:hypothetical protein
MLKPAARIAAIVVLAATMSACSAFKLFYGLADNFIVDEFEFYLDPDEAESEYIQAKVDAFVDWHTKEMLPRYAVFLEVAAGDIETGAPAGALAERTVAGLRDLMAKLTHGAAPYMADILARHTGEADIAYIQARLDEGLGKYREKIANPRADQDAKRRRRMTEHFERVTGPLNEAQKGAIARFVSDTGDTSERWAQSRALRQQAIVDFLNTRPDAGRIADFIPRFVLHGDRIADPDYGPISEWRWRRFTELLRDVVAAMNDHQRHNTAQTLRDYAADMRDLAS